ncbi:MAG: exonuclease, partial [Ligilactobacillus sp.]|nr:exonuclease [Ligilactobacillus sp.]
KDVATAPTFAELCPHISSFFTPDQLVVAHNAPFDCSVLNKTLATYGLATPSFMVLDTVKTSKQFYQDLPDHKLNTVCDSLGIALKHHHNALFDSHACAEILLHQVKEFGPTKLKPFVRQYNK